MNNLFGIFDASIFKKNARLYYEGELVNILKCISECYKISISLAELYTNNEDSIRDQLHCNYLNNITIKKKLGLSYHFECEPKEFGNGEGYLDLKVFNENIFKDPSEYYIIECKRLDNVNVRGKTGLNALYIEKGIMRFVEMKYSTYHNVNAMIGFIVQKMDLHTNISNLNYVLQSFYPQANTIQELESYTTHTAQPYFSKHSDINGKTFTIFHLMLDYSSNIKS